MVATVQPCRRCLGKGAGAETRVKLTLRSAALTWGIETAVHSLFAAFGFEMGMNAVGPRSLRGAPAAVRSHLRT